MITRTQLEAISQEAEAADQDMAWPTAIWNIYREAGVFGWSIPQNYGGSEKSSLEIFTGMEALAGVCLTTAFAFSQRETAIRRILAGPEHLKQKHLPQLAAGTDFLTVGLSQLTTSRQHIGPALTAEASGEGYLIHGEIPWVTGGDRSSALVVGATLSDLKQILFLLPTDQKGVQIDPPMPITALRGSRTAAVHCDQVIVENSLLIAGPSEAVLGKVGGGGLETSCLALGLAGAAIDSLEEQAKLRPPLQRLAEKFEEERVLIRQRLHQLVSSTPDPEATLKLRVDCTRLALKSTQANLLATKGAGFISPHPAQRWARQAMFFLVWSCPRPVVEGMLEEFLGE
ncbi:acyl-CoA/acyl-ACP dehydrogenase [Telmatocola sphagniphila]|uniref:Acyl-CoA/acyl-ACP dehydrogenase n=1 Tax=Telmatocola sphagniphila TaxID=1123043 RepID=A0A8E6B9S4_9BACT|nr:acyl-CoA dehydrogenase family protein [Telmatocola sphagniphila]QVL34512.1 acyl-CoA/acyl-ACP dehydrogenase [Telmatocola sphagniphila]